MAKKKATKKTAKKGKRKFSPKQLEAQRKFAAAVKSGKFKKKKK